MAKRKQLKTKTALEDLILAEIQRAVGKKFNIGARVYSIGAASCNWSAEVVTAEPAARPVIESTLKALQRLYELTD
jgi:hypothetical protein